MVWMRAEIESLQWQNETDKTLGSVGVGCGCGGDAQRRECISARVMPHKSMQTTDGALIAI